MNSQVFWHLTDYCDQECTYCPARYRGGSSIKELASYLSVVKKIQDSRYKHAEKIVWQLSGGELITLPNITSILKQIKTRPSFVKIETSGGTSWFDYMSIQDYIDQITLTYHHWQNPSIAEYIIDFCQTNNKIIRVKVPYFPGKVKEQMALIADLNSRKIPTRGMPLYVDARSSNPYIDGYSANEINLMNGREENWVPPPPAPVPPRDPSLPDPNWIDPTKPSEEGQKQSVGTGCYAGVDYIYISHKGFATGSDCGGRTLGNVFESDWLPPRESFNCPMFLCHSHSDKKKIRMASNNYFVKN